MLSGAAGMVWYSYWIQAKGYGAARAGVEQGGRPAARPLGAAERARLRGWVGQMTLDCTVAVGWTLLVTLAFLILGAELLRPRGLVPEEERIAEVLGVLLGAVWGPVGFWFMVLGVFVGFWDTVLSNTDGFGRMFADGTRIVARPLGLRGRWADEERLRRFHVVGLITLLPLGLCLLVGSPVALLAIAGAIEAAHIPVVAALTLLLNRRLPADLRPSWPTAAAVGGAALFFAGFAAFYLARLTRVVP
jgi:hypothetical protein